MCQLTAKKNSRKMIKTGSWVFSSSNLVRKCVAIRFQHAIPASFSSQVQVAQNVILFPKMFEVMQSPTSKEVDDLVRFFCNSSSVTVLTGAGISTSSGIPDYRGPQGSYKLGHKPMTHTEFMTKELSRKRFWARSMVGWLTVSAAEPNDAHTALAGLESNGKVGGIITQNVDRLHHRAGSNNIMDLHGRVDQVRCQCCKKAISREEWQYALISRNASFLERTKEQQRLQALQVHSRSSVRADGDAELGELDYNEVRRKFKFSQLYNVQHNFLFAKV